MKTNNINILKKQLHTQINNLTDHNKPLSEYDLINIQSVPEDNTKNDKIIDHLLSESNDISYESYRNILHDFEEMVENNNVDKQKFTSLFFYSSKTKHYINHILECLLNKKIINEKEIIKSKKLDAEINIIKNIRKNKDNNIIISTDQDVLLFSLLHIENDFIFFNPTIISLKTDDMCIMRKNNLSKNISILTFIFNKSDYFNGISRFKVNINRIKKLTLKNIKILSIKIDDIFVLCATFLSFFLKETNNYKNKHIILTPESVNDYFNNIKLYFSLNDNFYNEYIPSVVDIKDFIFYLNSYKVSYIHDIISGKPITKIFNF